MIGRREFVGGLGAAAVWPFAARAQQRPALPVIGVLGGSSPASYADRIHAFRQGLKDAVQRFASERTRAYFELLRRT
jgi:hypothetical protein